MYLLASCGRRIRRVTCRCNEVIAYLINYVMMTRTGSGNIAKRFLRLSEYVYLKTLIAFTLIIVVLTEFDPQY